MIRPDFAQQWQRHPRHAIDCRALYQARIGTALAMATVLCVLIIGLYVVLP